MSYAIRVESVGKQYRLGVTHAGSIRELVNRGWKRMIGRKEALLPHEEAQLRGISELEGDTFWALKDVSFDVKPGEVVGIIGRNGSGKSTLLKILSQITAPTTGRIELRGRVASLLEIGTGFHPELSGRENIFLNGAILGMTKSEIRRKFDEIVAFTEIEKFIDTPVKRYSSGMYIRLAFAVAAHLEPEILVVDEVLAVGDAAFQKRCMGRMAEVARGGRTILFVSHNLGAVRSLCTRAVWLDKGKVVEHGPTTAISDRYLQSTSAPSSRVIELKKVKPNLGGSAFQFSRVILNGGECVRHGEVLNVHFYYEASMNAKEVAVGIGFSDLNGTRILTIDSDLRGTRPDISKNTKGEIHFALDDFPLQPGIYNLDVGARSGDKHGLIYLQGCAQIEVLPGPNTPSSIIGSGGDGVRLAPEIEWEEHCEQQVRA